MIYQFCRWCCIALIASSSMAFSTCAIAADIFAGKFASLPVKALSVEANELEIYVVQKGDKYVVTEYSKGKFQLDYLAKRCDSQIALVMPHFASAVSFALCSARSAFSPTLVYSKNGMTDRSQSIRSMKSSNGESLFGESHWRAQFFVPPHVALRKVNSFRFAPNDPAKLLSHETPEFLALCKDAGVKLFDKPAAPVKSMAYDFDPKRVHDWSGASRVEVDEDGRTLQFGGFIERNSREATKSVKFEFTERRAGAGAGAATINSSAPYYRSKERSDNQPYFGVSELSADIVAFLDVHKPDEYRKAPVLQGAIRYQITLTDRRSDAVLGVYVFVVDRLNHRACGVNVDSAISIGAFIFDAINR